MKHFINIPPASCCFLFLGLKHSPQHLVLKHLTCRLWRDDGFVEDKDICPSVVLPVFASTEESAIVNIWYSEEDQLHLGGPAEKISFI
jgi:hypothetical protein